MPTLLGSSTVILWLVLGVPAYGMTTSSNKTLSSGPSTNSQTSAVGLKGRVWQLVEFEGGATAVAGSEATLEFGNDGAKVSGFAGCNRYGGTYQSNGRTLTFTRVRSTMMACPEGPVGEQERRFLAGLGQVGSFESTGAGLRLLSKSGAPLMSFVVRSDLALEDVEWTALAINNGKRAVASVVRETVVTATFRDGKISGSGGCNDYQAGYALEDGSMRIAPGVATRKMCTQPERLMEQEGAYFAALETVAAYRIDRNILELRTADGALAVRFKAGER